MPEGDWTERYAVDAGATSITGTVREHNEDAACAHSEMGMVAVADGLGGHNAGEQASGIAIEVLERRLGEIRDAGASPTVEQMFEAFGEANTEILQDAEANPERAGMGTTLTCLVLVENRVLVGHIGDSRAWRIRDGFAEQLTRDHTLVGQQVRDGSLTEEEAENHPMRHVLSRCLGVEPSIEVDLVEGDLDVDDIYVLASDGLVHGLDGEAIARIAMRAKEAEEASSSLVNEACEIDGTDNITAAVLVCRER